MLQAEQPDAEIGEGGDEDTVDIPKGELEIKHDKSAKDPAEAEMSDVSEIRESSSSSSSTSTSHEKRKTKTEPNKRARGRGRGKAAPEPQPEKKKPVPIDTSHVVPKAYLKRRLDLLHEESKYSGSGAASSGSKSVKKKK